MTTKKLLTETLDQLSPEDFAEFKSVIEVQKNFTLISKRELKAANTKDVVELMEETYGRGCEEEIRKALMKMRRTDLVQRLSDKQFPALSQRVEMMESLIELLLETLADLSYSELKNFKHVLKRKHEFTPWSLSELSDLQGTVFVAVQTFGQQSVKKTMEVLKDIRRTDLAQRLSDCSSEHKKKHLDEHLSALIHKVATMAAVKELLLETLKNLSEQELNEFHLFLKFTCFMMSLPQIHIDINMVEELVNQMVDKLGQRSVEVIREVLTDMKRSDLVQRLSESSSGLKEKHSEDERWPALIHTVETMESVIELLLETLAALNDQELTEFKKVQFEISYRKYHSGFTLMLNMRADLQDTVFLMVQTYGQQSVEKTMEGLKVMKRTDLAQRLSDCSSLPRKKHSVDDGRSALIHKVATMAAVKHLLLGTLNDLSNEEFEEFKRFLQRIFPQKNQLFSLSFHRSDRAAVVDLMVDKLQRSVETTRKVFMYMKRTDLIQKLPESSSGSREKLSVDEDEAALLKREEAVRQILSKTLKDLRLEEVNKFSLFLKFMCFKMSLPQIHIDINMAEVVDQMVDKLGQRSVEVIREVLTDMKRSDLVQRLSESSSGLKGEAGGSSESEDCGSMKQDSSDWTKLEPEVNGADADEAPTYSLQSEAGHFECSVSGLRWVCKEKASFQYQFSSWEGHVERMESRRYMPAGPLMDVTVTAGKLNEVHLPHWICTDDIPDILDQFAVLHIDDCGDVVEKVSEVTPSHVKLMEPTLSLRAVLMKVGFPVKIRCNVLIYQTNTAFLTLHVYLVPDDPGLQKTMDRREESFGYKVIRKPHPEESLKMFDRFILTANLDGAEICPETLQLRYESRTPNFFEVYIKNPDHDFKLNLTPEKERQLVWTCAVRKDECQTTGNTKERHTSGQSPKPGDNKHFVDKHRVQLTRKVTNISSILDELFDKNVINKENYDTIRALPTSQEKMRELYESSLNAEQCKDIFYEILLANEKFLVDELHAKK